jgi:hypothetical protein
MGENWKGEHKGIPTAFTQKLFIHFFFFFVTFFIPKGFYKKNCQEPQILPYAQEACRFQDGRKHKSLGPETKDSLLLTALAEAKTSAFTPVSSERHEQAKWSLHARWSVFQETMPKFKNQAFYNCEKATWHCLKEGYYSY